YVEKDNDGVYRVFGPRVEKMLGYTNLESEKGFAFFQNFMKENQVIDRLKELGITEGDTVNLCDYFDFEYYE
ncbi:MAG: Obg family GTPase CgtA, partial [Lachnospiraceae bacterium]|nr:Obg family GTPase CgtA [Lachnospiraceae bacterium]